MRHIGVLALQGDFREHLTALARLGVCTTAVRSPAELSQLDGLVIPGGESTVIDRLARSYGLTDPLRELIASGVPVYGSCAGMIMLADRIENPAISATGRVQESFGGIDMTVRRNAFGRQVDSFESSLKFNGIELDAVFIRAPEAVQIGPTVQVLCSVPAQLPGFHDRIVAVRQGNLLATSFHPEVTGSNAIHEFFINMTRGDA